MKNMSKKDSLHKPEILKKLRKVAYGYKMKNHILLIEKELNAHEKNT